MEYYGLRVLGNTCCSGYRGREGSCQTHWSPVAASLARPRPNPHPTGNTTALPEGRHKWALVHAPLAGSTNRRLAFRPRLQWGVSKDAPLPVGGGGWASVRSLEGGSVLRPIFICLLLPVPALTVGTLCFHSKYLSSSMISRDPVTGCNRCDRL